MRRIPNISEVILEEFLIKKNLKVFVNETKRNSCMNAREIFRKKFLRMTTRIKIEKFPENFWRNFQKIVWKKFFRKTTMGTFQDDRTMQNFLKKFLEKFQVDFLGKLLKKGIFSIMGRLRNFPKEALMGWWWNFWENTRGNSREIS